MSFIGDAIGDLVGGITGAKQAGQAGERAGQLQAESAQAGIDEQKRQFNTIVQLMSPYVGAGSQSLAQQKDLLGMGRPGSQQAAIDKLAASPLMQSLVQQGENAMLQNASATGGLRGGNIQGALAQFRPQMLNQVIDQQYTRLGNLAQLGQASAGMQAAQGMQSASNIGNLLAQQGAALAGSELARGSVARNTFGDILNTASVIMGGGKKQSNI